MTASGSAPISHNVQEDISGLLLDGPKWATYDNLKSRRVETQT